MKRNILTFICGIALVSAFWSCKNGDQSFPDFQDGTTVYFPYQYPVRTIVLGDDEYDLTYDHAWQCQIKATFGGSYNGSNGSVKISVDPNLVKNLTFEDGSPVKVMPGDYYDLSTDNLEFKGTMNGSTVVQLTEKFFNDPDAIKNTYVIPVVMVSQTGFTKINAGELSPDYTSADRTDADKWNVKPMDYVLYCVKFQNKYSGWWLTNGTTDTKNIEKAQTVQIKTKSLNESIYTVSFQDGSNIYTADLLLSFKGDQCTISNMTDNGTATGTGTFGDNTEKKAWGNKDRDGLELNYTINFTGGKTYSVHEKLVWQRSGVTIEEFTPIYVK